MPARDRDHDALRDALVAEGWVITADPLHLRYAGDDLYVDLAVFESGVARMILARQIQRLVSFDVERRVIVRWIP